MDKKPHDPKFTWTVNEADRLDQDTVAVPDLEDEADFPAQLPVDADVADAVDQHRAFPVDDEDDDLI